MSGLPTGLKYATKKVTKKSGKKNVTVAEAYAVYGKTTKAGLFTITTKKKVNAQAARSTNGLATVTVSSVGKISGKFSENGTNWTFSAASYTAVDSGTRDACPYQEFICSNVVAKYTYKVKNGKQTVTKTLTRTFALTVSPVPIVPDVPDVPVRGFTTLVESGGRGATALPGEAITEITAYQNLWGSTYKAVGKALFKTKSGKKTLSYKTWASVEADGLGEYDTLSMKVASSGAVTATYRFFKGTFDKKTKKPQYVSYTCSSVLVPESSASAEGLTGFVPVFFPAAGGFGGYAGTVAYPFRDRGAE